MKIGEIRYRADNGVEVDLTAATVDALGVMLTDMDLAVLTAKLRIISARVAAAGAAGPIPVRPNGATPVDYSRAVEVMREVDQDPFR